MPLPAILLAAGASRRLGQPKQLVLVNEETLLARTIRVALAAGVAPVFVVLGAQADSIAASVDLSAIETVFNPSWEQGIASSIRAGVDAVARLNSPAVLLLVCDQPALTANHLRSLLAAFNRTDGEVIVASQYAGVAGIPAIFPSSQFGRLERLTGDTGARELLRNPECALLLLPFEGGEIDVDHPEDLPLGS